MKRRDVIAAGVGAVVATALAGGIAAAETKLNPSNSILFPFFASTSERVGGTGCGKTGTFTRRLPTGATGIKVVEPRVGARDGSRGTRVTAVTVTGTTVKVTVVADGPSVCDPAKTGVPPGEPVKWVAQYDLRAEYKRRVQATIRVFYESYLYDARWQLRPTTISDSRRGARQGERYTGIRWAKFGGRTATGFGTLRLDYCRPNDNCPTNGKRVKLVASKPDYCMDSGEIEYLMLSVYLGKLELSGHLITCH
jgi:hypothetical protein